MGWRFLLFSWLSFSTVSPVGDSRDRLRESPDDGEGGASYDAGGSLCDGAETTRASGQVASAARVKADEQGEREWRERPRARRSRRGAPSRRTRTSDRRSRLRSETAEQAARDARHASAPPSIQSECSACSEDGSDEASVGEAGYATTIEAGWRGARARALGSIEAHVTFLQWVFRATTGVARGCWSRGGLREPLRVALAFGRRVSHARCENGANLASDEEFATQRALSEEMLDWYGTYVALLRRLDSGKTPFAIQNFCGGGGSSEGCRRAGGASHGVDLYHQGDYCRRFGPESFTQADGMNWSTIHALKSRHKAKFIIGGPPCKFYSRARVKGEAKQPPLIEGFRDMCKALFGTDGKWAVENVMGAAEHMATDAARLDGSLFGLRVARSRLYETNFALHVDECVRVPAAKLAERCCLGGRRRFRRFDEFGRPEKTACCDGNIFAVQGTSPWKCTSDECAEAMGVDVGHMSYERLAQSVPPQYGQLVYSQMCMHQAHDQYGAPIITFDDLRARPSWARRTMAFWLRGAGEADASIGQLFQPAPPPATRTEGSTCSGAEASNGLEEREEFRELFYSHAGGYTQQWVAPRFGGRLAELSRGRSLTTAPGASTLAGENTFIEVDVGAVGLARQARRATSAKAGGTRVTMVVPSSMRGDLERAGFVPLACRIGGRGEDALAARGKVAMTIGRRAGPSRRSHLDHTDVIGEMDWRDQGGYEFDPVEKARATWQDFPHDPERYRGKGLPQWVEEMMTEGAVVNSEAEVIAADHQQYMWPDGVALTEAIMETERHLAIGALEYVPLDEVEAVLRDNVVHPILLVAQGKGKFRACHDYSRGTNNTSRSAPFMLPSVWAARDVVKGGSYFCKYDLRDGFFSIPVHENSRNKLVIRHPATGRLLRCRRLPFGFVDSPRLFCGLTEAVADIVRRRTAGKGVHVFVFVDDFLIVGDDREAARLGGETLEQVLHELGIPWAPHKQRGPARCMEFLGLLLCNVPGHRCVALTKKRQEKLLGQIDEWRRRRPSRVGSGAGGGVEGPTTTANVHELASFLGHLVFCSQVVPHGRTYMQGMLSQFKGLEVDWRRGEVRPSRSMREWKAGVPLGDGFWRDLEWWHEHFSTQNSTSMEVPVKGEVAICGTDASDWGTGQLMWSDGRRAETVMEFTATEQARSINWRELLGITRVVEQFGEELRGRSLLIEGDNTASLAAATNESSKAEDSQELVRRLVELIDKLDLTVRFTHTPGVKLDRPDQTSRGDPIEEPRARVDRDEYNLLNERYGPFTEWLGAERRFAEGRSAEGSTRIWMHPSHTTVGSALRRLGERLGDRDGETARGVVVVPHDPGARWWPLVRHFAVAGRWPEGSDHLEVNRLGRWESTKSLRPSLILTFPRSAGRVKPVLWRAGVPKDGYTWSAEAEADLLAMPAGSYFYVPDDKLGSRGVLYCTWMGFNPNTEGKIEYDDGKPMLRGAEMRMYEGEQGSTHFALDGRGSAIGGSFVNDYKSAWAVDVDLAFDVTHMVSIQGGTTPATTATGRVKWDSVKRMQVSFDWRAAEAEMTRVMEGVLQEATVQCEGCDGTTTTGAEQTSGSKRVQMCACPWAECSRVAVRRNGAQQEGFCEGCMIGCLADCTCNCRYCRERREEQWGPGGGERVPHSERPRRDGNGVVHLPAGAGVCPPGSDATTAADGSTAELAAALQGDDAAAGEPSGVHAALEAARASAAEAAAARRHVSLQPARPSVLVATVAPRAEPLSHVSICRYSGMRCTGCGEEIGWGKPMRSVGPGVTHDVGECEGKAKIKMNEELAAIDKARAEAATAGQTSLKRGAQEAHRLSEARITNVMDCLEGCCKETQLQQAGVDAREERMMCLRGCGRGLHGRACAGFSAGIVALGNLTCAFCRAADVLSASCSPPKALVWRMAESMVIEASTGAANTHKGYSDLTMLERKWQATVAGDSVAARDVRLPHTSEEACYHFCLWLTRDGGRARSFGTTMIQMSSFCSKLMIENPAKSKRIQNLIKELDKKGAAVSAGDTPVTAAMILEMYGAAGTIAQACRKCGQMARHYWRRETMLNDFELVGGARVGEVCGGGDGHGLLANNVCIQTPLETTELAGLPRVETIEAKIEDSKTAGLGRYVVFCGKTLNTKIETAQHLREYCELYEIKMTTTTVMGFREERPDYWVVRVSLIDMSAEMFNLFMQTVEYTTNVVIMTHRKDTLFYAKMRRTAKTIGEEMRYVNVAGGQLYSTATTSAMAWLNEKGFGSFTSLVPGPLVRATRGHQVTHMPFSPKSTHVHLVPAMENAFDRVRLSGVPDPEYDQLAEPVPKFGNHSNRRYADQVALRYAQLDNVSKVTIDFFFGWNLKKMKEDMMLHYAGMNRVMRLALSKVTMRM